MSGIGWQRREHRVHDLDPSGVVGVLNRHGVRFVVIGGIAAQAHDLPLPATIDIDVTPARDPENLGRLASAFEELEARLLTADESGTWSPRVPVENWAQYDVLHLITVFGPLDIVFVPDGAPGGFSQLATDAIRLPIGDEAALVVSIPTWIALKEATGRAKDLEHLDRYLAQESDS